MSEDHEHSSIRFLRKLRPDGAATFIVAFDPEGGGPKDSQLFEPSTYHQLPGWLEKQNEKLGRNVYLAINPVRPDFKAGGHAQVKDEDIARVEFLQADFDVPKNPNAEKRTPAQREADWQRRLEEMLGELGEWRKAGRLPLASAAWSSGGGKWMLWRLAEPLPMTPELPDRVREANRQIAEALRPWADRSAVNAGRLARFPETTNYPGPDKRAQGRKAVKAGKPYFPPETYDFESFARRLPSSSAPREGEPVERRPAAPGSGTPGGGPPAPVRGANLPEWAKAHPLLQAGEVEPIRSGLDPWDVFEPYGLSPNVLRIIAGGSQGLDPEEREARAERGTDMSPSGWVFPVWCEFARRGVPYALAIAATEVEDWGLYKYRHRPAGAKRKRITREHLLSEFRNAVADCIDKGDLRAPDAPRGDFEGLHDRAAPEPEGELGGFRCNKGGQPFADDQHNIRLAIERLGVRLSYDEFADQLLVKGLDRAGPELDDAARDRLWLTIDTHFGFKPQLNVWERLVTVLAHDNAFHPVCDYLARVEPEWDGVERLDTWLIDYLDAEDTPFNRAVGALMLVAAARRARSPGCKFDEMLVLEGETGIGKSSAVEALLPDPEWFSDNFDFSLKDKQVLEHLAGRWIIEVPELKGLRQSDADARKSFMSRKVDRGRLAYARTVSTVPRRCIFFGTTNDDRYLNDPTGNRRYWPVRVTRADPEGIAEVRDQLWAEAARREASGVSIRLDPALYPAAREVQAKRELDDGMTDYLAELLVDNEGDPIEGKIRAADVREVLGIEPAAGAAQTAMRRMGSAMRKLGFERKKARFSGKVVFAYVRGDGAKSWRARRSTDRHGRPEWTIVEAETPEELGPGREDAA